MPFKRFQITVLMTLLGILSLTSTGALGLGNDPIYQKAAKQTLKLLKNNDILIFGERHDIKEGRELLMNVLRQGVENGEIDTFVTEYSMEETEIEFQKYLTNVAATPHSEIETQFFDLYDQQDYLWFKSEFNKDFFRFLRELKLKYGDRIKICGLDVQFATYLTEDENEQKVIRENRLNKLPFNILQEILNLTSHTLKELSGLDIGYDRESNMALRANQCIGDRKKSIVHMGLGHANRPNYRDDDSKAWLFTSTYIQMMAPTKKIVVVADGETGLDDDALSKRFTELNHAVNAPVPTLFRTSPGAWLARDILIRKNLDHWQKSLAPTWDYIILGPKVTPLGVFN